MSLITRILNRIKNRQSPKKNMEHIAALVGLAHSDGHLAKSELDFIVRTGETMGLSAKDVKKVIRNKKYQNAQNILINERNSRFQLMMTYIGLIIEDKIIFDDELAYCRSLAQSMGYHADVVDMLLDKMCINPGERNDLGTIEKVVEVFMSE